MATRKTPDPLRLRELRTMFQECERLSDKELLFLPGEEANSFLGNCATRQRGRTLAVPLPEAGLLDDEPRRRGRRSSRRSLRMERFITSASATICKTCSSAKEASCGRRIRGSKARAGPLTVTETHGFSAPTTGWGQPGRPCRPIYLTISSVGRVLDLMDDMANWGEAKYVLGEVDVFKLDHTHELYGHMNVNYLRLEPDALPRFSDGWRPVLDTLRLGQFFVTTGEVLIPEFQVNGKPSGSGLRREAG